MLTLLEAGESRAVAAAAVVFALTYVLLGIQRIPGIHIGRPAGALLGAVAMVGFGVISFDEAKAAIDLDTILFLLGTMIVLGYLEISGFFEVVERRVLGLAGSARSLLATVAISSGVLSALFMNDTVCLMLTPVVLRVARRLGLSPVPFLVALVTSANVGSSATIVGNPQNALVGVRSGIPFASFAAALLPVAALGLATTIAILCFLYRREVTSAPIVVPPPREPVRLQTWMLLAALGSGLGLVGALILGATPGSAAMAAAAAVIVAGAARPREALRRVDWSLLLLFGGLFVVMRGVEQAGLAGLAVDRMAGALGEGGPLAQGRLAIAVAFVSQAVSNVPAVMLFVPAAEALPSAAAPSVWLGLAAYSTLAGNLTLLASVANLIVWEGARKDGVEIGFGAYLRAGVPVTVATLAIGWTWLSLVQP